jgi:electron transport complex protein RnfA
MSDQTLFSIFFSAMVVNNFTLAMFLGLCPFMGVSARVETALRMGLANIFVLVLTSLSAWVLNTYILENAPYLRIISFIIVVASLVQIVEMVVKKISPTLFRQLGIFLPLMTTNCAIFGLAIFQTNRGYDFLQGMVFAVGAGLGLTLALVLMASIRETSELSDIPAIAKGTGLTLIIAGSRPAVAPGRAVRGIWPLSRQRQGRRRLRGLHRLFRPVGVPERAAVGGRGSRTGPARHNGP